MKGAFLGGLLIFSPVLVELIARNFWASLVFVSLVTIFARVLWRDIIRNHAEAMKGKGN